MREIKGKQRLARLVFLAAIMLPAVAISAGAQTSAANPDTADELKTQEQILDELKFRRAQVNALQTQVSALTDQVKTLTDLSAVLRERGDFYKDAASARNGAGELEAEKDRINRERLEEMKGELVRLRTENDKLRHSRDVRTILGFAIGAGTAFGLGR